MARKQRSMQCDAVGTRLEITGLTDSGTEYHVSAIIHYAPRRKITITAMPGQRAPGDPFIIDHSSVPLVKAVAGALLKVCSIAEGEGIE